MEIGRYIKEKEKELKEMYEPNNEFVIQGKILNILAELEDAVKYWKRRFDEGGVADTRLDRADAVVDFDFEEDFEL